MNKRIAIVGATGAVGSLIRQVMVERRFDYDAIRFIASRRSAGQTITFDGADHCVHELTPDCFEDTDIVIGSTPDEVAEEFVPWAIKAGAVVVDESGAHRMRPDVPLVIPEVNPEAIAQHQGLIASPNCSTTQLVVALKPLHDFGTVQRVVVTTYQATSGAGQSGSADLLAGTRAALEDSDWDYQAFAHPIAFNVIPQIGSPRHEGYTSEEMKMVWETRKIFNDDSIEVCPTCVRVPVVNGHSESIVVETQRPIPPETARKLFAAAEGISVVDDLAAGQFPMPLNCHHRDDVFIGRIRRDISHDNGLVFWCVSDNLRKGAATNAVQIAEILVSQSSFRCGT